MQIAIVERKQLTDALFERKPVVFNGVQIQGVRWQEFLSAARAFNEPAGFGGWDHLDLQQAYALQEMQEEHRRRLNTCRGAAEGAYE